MEVHQLRYLVAVADTGSFTTAAMVLHVSQPAVSAQVRRLERELGEQLLDRSGARTAPTEVGAAVVPLARRVLDLLGEVDDTVAAFSGLLRGRLSLGMITGSPSLRVPELLRTFAAQHPGVAVSLREGASAELVDGLRDGSLDVAVVALDDDDDSQDDLVGVTLDEQPLVAAVASDHPLASRERIGLRQLLGHRLIALRTGTGTRALLERHAARVGRSADVAFEMSDPRMVIALAAMGFGPAVLPAAAVAGEHRLRAVPIVRPVLRGRVGLAWWRPAPSGPAARAFVELIREQTEQP